MSKSAAKANVPLTVVPPVPQSTGGNRDAMQKAMFDKVDELGELEGKGGNSRATLAVMCTEWAYQGIADVGDAQTIYSRYLQKSEDVAAVFGGLKPNKDPVAGMKQNTSKIRQFLKLGGLKTIDAIKVINVAAGVVKDERAKGTITQSPFDALLNIARKQCAQTQAELSRQEMVQCNMPKEAGDLVEADELAKIAAKLEKYETTFGLQDETTEALEGIRSRIDALGGTTVEKKQKEAARKKAEAAAKKKK